MGAKGVVVIVIILVIMFLVYPLVVEADRDRDRDRKRDDRVDWDEMMDDDNMAEILWANCGAELVYSIQDFQDLQYCDDDKTLIGKQRILKAIHVQDPHVKKIILDCLRVKRIVLSDVRKNKPTRKWYVEYLVSFLHKPNDGPTRRKLAEGSVSNGMVVVVVIGTAVVTLCLAGLLFYCYIRKCVVLGDQNDEKPLLSFGFGNSKKISNTKGKNESTENESTQVSVDSGLEMKALDPSMQPPGGRVKESMRHTLKPRAVRAESSLRPTRMMDFSQRPTGNTESPVVATELSPKPSPIEVESSSRKPHVNVSSPVSSPAINTPQPPSKAPQSAPEPPSLPTGGAPPAPTGGTPPSAGDAPPPPPSARGAPPPPPPTGGVPPPPPKLGGNGGGPPPPPRRLGASKVHRRGDQADVSKAKLKPFFWDKVMAKPDQQMVWDKIKSGSFQFNEEMIESLFGYQGPPGRNKDQDTKNGPAKENPAHFIQIIDPKKAQNLSILLKALNVTTEEVSTALIEGNELPIEIVQTLLKMAPTSEEELKLRLYGGDLSRLGAAERFLKVLVEIPYAFKRLESLLFMSTLQDEEANIKESFETLEAACIELKKSRLFHKLLEAVLKTGNRMNVGTFRGSATAFKLDTLLKLSDVKGIDGKTTLLHFVVQEIMRGEGLRAVRAAKDGKSDSNIKTEYLLLDPLPEDCDEHYCKLGLEVVSGLSTELENVTKAAIIDTDGLTSSVSKLGHGLVKARESLNTDMKNLEEQSGDEEEGDEFWLILSGFVENAEKDIAWMLEEEKRIMALMKDTADYFHGNSKKDEGLRLFTVVRDFLVILERVCKEIQAAPIKPPKKKDDLSLETPKSNDPNQPEGPMQHLAPGPFS